GWAAQNARAELPAFALPTYGGETRQALRLAVAEIRVAHEVGGGCGDVAGDETDSVSSPYGYQAHGGYDCSVFVWRVFKLSGLPAGAKIGGRTAAQSAGEVPNAAPLKLHDGQPGD